MGQDPCGVRICQGEWSHMNINSISSESLLDIRQVYADATLVFPMLVAATFAQDKL